MEHAVLPNALNLSERFADRRVSSQDLRSFQEKLRELTRLHIVLARGRRQLDSIRTGTSVPRIQYDRERLAREIVIRAMTTSCQTRLVNRAISDISIAVAWEATADDPSPVWDERPQLIADQERNAQADLHREVYGHYAGHRIPIEESWLNRNVRAIANSIYDDQRFDDLTILADALEDAGCDNADILGHLRGPGPHVRGCWPVDLILAKE